jgi:hypothetical protein
MTPRPNPFPKFLHFDNAGTVDGRRIVVVTQPFPVVTSIGCFTVHSGFLSDGASIPQVAQSIVGSPLDFMEQAVAHDWLYSRHSDRTKFTRSDADMILKETMWNCGLPLWKILAFHAAVRAFGWRYYKKK